MVNKTQTLTGRRQLTASGLNTIGAKVTLNGVTVHLDSQLYCTFCGLGFPLQPYLTSKGKTDSPHTLSPLTFSCSPFPSEVTACPPFCLGSRTMLLGGCSHARQPSLQLPLPHSLPHSTRPAVAAPTVLQPRRLADLMAQAGRHVGHHKPPQHQAARHHPLPARRARDSPPYCNCCCFAQRFITCSCHNLFTRHKSHENKVDEVCV